MTIGKPVAGVCVSTALFVCGAAGYPSAPDAPPESSGPIVFEAANADGTLPTLSTGDSYTINGDGFMPGGAITIVMYSTPRELAQVVANGEGELDASVEIPDDLTGDHTLAAIGNDADGDPHVLSTPVEVVASQQTSPLPTLPRTGLNIVAMFLGGFGLLIAGFAFVRTAVFGRRLVER